MLVLRQLNDSLPLLAGENTVIDVGRCGNNAVDGGVDLDLLRLGHVVVRLLFIHLRQITDDERTWIADAPLVDHAHIVDTHRDIAGNGHVELARPPGSSLGLHFRIFLGVFLGVFLRILLWIDHRLRHRWFDQHGLDAVMVKQQGIGPFEIGANEADFTYRGSKLSPERKNAVEVGQRGTGLLLLGQGRCRQQQRKTEDQNAESHPAGFGASEGWWFMDKKAIRSGGGQPCRGR